MQFEFDLKTFQFVKCKKCDGIPGVQHLMKMEKRIGTSCQEDGQEGWTLVNKEEEKRILGLI